MIAIRVPASTANLGPGFDTLSVALSLYNAFELEPAPVTSVNGCSEKFAGPDNLFLQAMRRTFGFLNAPAPHVSLSIRAEIPIARGLGSSAAMIAGGVAAAVLLYKKQPEKSFSESERQFILDATAEIEGHPDNAASAVLGGFCASIVARPDENARAGENGGGRPAGSPDHIVAARSEVAADWTFHALIPPFELSTREARAALPASLPLRDAVFNVGRAALTALAFDRHDAGLLSSACDDRIHQPYRKALIPGYGEVFEACRRAGAAAVWLSGAGPTILALTTGEEAAARFQEAAAPALAARAEGAWLHRMLKPDNKGVTYEYD